MASEWLCEGCDATNRARSAFCENCGAERPTAAIATRGQGPSRCPFDGDGLHANGWCPTGNGYPITRKTCPDVCDRCRSPLSWTGTCMSCDAYAPGHRYDYEPPGTPHGGHWRIVEKGPFVILPPHEQAAKAREFSALVARLEAKMRVDFPGSGGRLSGDEIIGGS